jgi:hypothetical protein
VSSYDPAVLVRNARIAENYRFDIQSRLAGDGGVQCVACSFQSRLPGTLVFKWRRFDEDVEPPVVELCEICNAAAGGPSATNR